jgi:hypothetical protein
MEPHMAQGPKPSYIPNVFAMNEPQHMWVKLAWELQHLTDCMSVWVDNGGYPEPLFRAFNTAVTAWHISDWLWQSSPETRAVLKKRFKVSCKETPSGISKGLKRFQDAVAKDCRALHICREIANGSKHMRKANPDPAIKAMARWDPVVEGAGLVKPGDLIMSLIIADGAKEQDAVLWFIEAFGYWEHLLSTEKLFAAPTRLPNRVIRPNP